MSVKLYCDLMSQPSRALYILLKKVKCNLETKFVNLSEAEHYGEEFTKINRFQKVPVIEYKGFVLTESVAIMRYLSRENIIPDSLYPKDSKKQARVDEFLEWQHIGLRTHCAMYFRVKYLNPRMFGKVPSEKSLASWQARMESALEEFNTKWLGRGHSFLTGDTVTVADLLAICELEQPRMAGYDPREKYANIAAWYDKVRQHFNPYYDEAHVILNKIVKKQNEAAAKL